jgi:SAM-dependent methyltransferase
MHGRPAVSAWIARWSHLIGAGGTVLDVAAGAGRHTRWLAQRGHAVTAVDRDETAMRSLREVAETIVADLEGGPWPLGDRRFAAVVVTNYLWRPLLPRLLAALEVGGVLLYETFAAGNESVGRPARPDFLLGRNELLRLAEGLRIVAFEDGFLDDPDRFVQRIAAVREAPDAPPPRYPLEAPAAVATSAGSLESIG